MFHKPVLLLLLCLPSALCCAQSDSNALAKAGKLFKNACTTCHLPPDPAQALDRAWLNQLKDTA